MGLKGLTIVPCFDLQVFHSKQPPLTPYSLTSGISRKIWFVLGPVLASVFYLLAETLGKRLTTGWTKEGTAFKTVSMDTTTASSATSPWGASGLTLYYYQGEWVIFKNHFALLLDHPDACEDLKPWGVTMFQLPSQSLHSCDCFTIG